MKETSKLRFPTRREQGRTIEHSDVESEKFQQKKFVCPYTYVCDITEHVCTEGN